jgi:hypothetical protein
VLVGGEELVGGSDQLCAFGSGLLREPSEPPKEGRRVLSRDVAPEGAAGDL